MKKAILLYFLFGAISGGVSQVATDSLLKKANFELYENPANAIKIGEKILGTKDISQENRIEALLLISTGYSSERNYAKSLDYAIKAAAELPKINDDKFKIIIYTRLGVQYQQLKVYDKAHSYLDKAIQVANNTKQKFNSHKLLGFNYAVRGMVYKEQMSCDIAQNYFNKALYHFTKSNHEEINYANTSVITYNKGNCFVSLNQVDSARICFSESYRYADKIKANSLKAFANKGLAEVNTLEGKYETAIKLLLEASKMSEGVGDLVLNQGIYKGLSDNYFLTNAIAKHERYERKYDETTLRIKTNNTKTLNQFVLEINTDNDKEVGAVKSQASYYEITLSAVVFLMLMSIVFETLKYRKRYKALKIQRENLENRLS